MEERMWLVLPEDENRFHELSLEQGAIIDALGPRFAQVFSGVIYGVYGHLMHDTFIEEGQGQALDTTKSLREEYARRLTSHTRLAYFLKGRQD